MKSILYPFGDKYNFLNNKWWHRLLKVIFYFAITIMFGSLVGSLIVGDPVFTVWNKNPIIWENSFTGVDIIWDDKVNNNTVKLFSGSETVKKSSIDDFANKIKEKYPEYADRDNKTLTEAVLKKYPVYKEKVYIEQLQENVNGLKLLYITVYYILNIIVYMFVTLIIYLLIKLIYYKGVMYVIYGDSINKQ